MLVADDEAIARKRLVRCWRRCPTSRSRANAPTRTRCSSACAPAASTPCCSTSRCPSSPGIEALQLFPADGPVVIFCTAHTAHAVAAFDVGAIDYLLKPVEAPRLHKALERARDRDARRRYRDERA